MTKMKDPKRLVLPSGRTPVGMLLEVVDFWDQIDRLAPLISIKGGKNDGKTLADILGSEPEVQNDLLALAGWFENLALAGWFENDGRER